ncbi:endodeoxyribonuclease [Synechococcus phage Yong-M3-232]|nr:endodeoxyribonuclease [Synechococcus phage Yong-M3-232]
MSGLTIDMPLPPSVNNLFTNLKGGGRAKSAVYKAWIEEARWHVMIAWRNAGKPEWPAETPMRLDMRLGIEGRRRDCSNCVKAIEDLLVKNLPVPDDCWNDAGSWQRDETIPGLARVTIAALEQGGSG